MSSPLSKTRNLLDEAKIKLNNLPEQSEYIVLFESVMDIVIFNEKKIWLRSKIGKPMVSRFEELASGLNRALDSANTNEVNHLLTHLVEHADTVNSESMRRNIVVT